MAVHSALQALRPASRGTSDGLHDYKYYVYFGGAALPALMASLAFTSQYPAYRSFGAFFAIYAVVGFRYRAYAGASQGVQTTRATMVGLTRSEDIEMAIETQQSRGESGHTRRASSIAHDVIFFKPQAPTTHTMNHMLPRHGLRTQSLPVQTTQNPLMHTTPVQPILFTFPFGRINEPSSAGDLDEPFPLTNLPSPYNHSHLTNPIQASPLEEERTHCQLRLLFVYPLVYTIMWIIPFIHHSMNYSNHYANYPLQVPRIGFTIYCLIFSMLEKPWRSMRSSDGTLCGSLTSWGPFARSESSAYHTNRSDRNWRVMMDRSMTTSGSGTIASRIKSVRVSIGDHTRIAAEQARGRLELEKEERRVAFEARGEANEIEKLDSSGWGESEESSEGPNESKQRDKRQVLAEGKGKEKAVD
ncbi:hypothetical protein GQ44DRAFT_737441 [Phaeosphaeriaceae sp. PMI808]|nr:hypothetical protein GQ44DRAFT_737441 [Phaeosphaeriaceae sp. PMI808]